MKTKEIAVSKSMQRRIAEQGRAEGNALYNKKDRPPKNPRVPIFPPQTVPLVNLLNQIIDNPETVQERRGLAYGVLSRLCVLWAPPIMRERFTVEAELVSYEETDPAKATARLSPGNGDMVNGLVTMMSKLFPDGHGLPEQEGCGPL